jgi:putative nucleotidyltransferase with HDIG domain
VTRTNDSRLRPLLTGGYCGAHILLGAGVLCWTAVNWQPYDHLRFFSYLLSAIVASVLKVRLPGMTGTASVSFLFVLIGIMDLSLPEAIMLGALSMLTQCTWRTERRPSAMQVGFSICSITIATYASALIYNYAHAVLLEPLALGLLALAYYSTNTFSVACIIALTESKPVWTVMSRNRWLLPYYAGGTSLAWMIGTMPRAIQWELPIICLPIIYVIHRSYRTFLVQMEQEKKHVEDMNSLHLRTIETLALAIEAKDHNTHDHLQRVQLYALEIGKDLALTHLELEALRVASVLHDIGKLAVPEYIISKPGKLTPEEFEKMKTHPVVGAEILERVEFPWPVVPIVRAHHEKWDGNGYPYGLKGKEIPIGARILSAVDCLDALASDRQYRLAMPLDEAMAKIASESGTSFDPTVVDALKRRYREVEAMAQERSAKTRPRLSTGIHIKRGSAPAAGFEAGSCGPAKNQETHSQGEDASMRRLADTISLRVSNAADLSREEILAMSAVRIKKAVPYDAMAFFVTDGTSLWPDFVYGYDSWHLQSLRIPLGEGLAGWVAQTRRPIINGNPSVDVGYGTAPSVTEPLRSALAIPMSASDAATSVLILYRRDRDAFGAQDLAGLLALCGPLTRVFDAPVHSSGLTNSRETRDVVHAEAMAALG